MKTVRINAPGDGEWIMERVGGAFHAGYDNVLANYDAHGLTGGFVLASYLGNAIAVHTAGKDQRWCTRTLLWMTFHYIFHQLGVHKALAPVQSDAYTNIAMYLRAGWKLETTIMDAYAPGCHMLILSMTAAECPWLRSHLSRNFRGINVEAAGYG